MKMTFIALVIGLLTPFSVFADTIPRFIWSDTTGFLPASQCQVRNESSTRFYISQKPNAGLNSAVKIKSNGFINSLFSVHLLDRSLVASAGAVNQAVANTTIRVLSVPENAVKSGMNKADVNDEGLAPTEALQEVGNFIIEVLDVPQFLKTARPLVQAHRTFWQASIDENEHYIIFYCNEGSLSVPYASFDVYNRTSIAPIAQVGLRIDQVSILSNINVYTPDEANQLLSPGGKKEIEEAKAKSPAPLGPVVPPVEPVLPGATSKPTPAATPVQAATPAVNAPVPATMGRLEYILCTDDDTVEVMDPDTKKILFTVEQFETVLPVQSWNEKEKSSYVEVQIPGRKSTPKSGWVNRDMVKIKSECLELKNSDDSKPENDNHIDMTGIKLNSKDCCKFPTIKRSTENYTSGILQFRARRRKGHRLHAGCDLYRKHGETVVAVGSGVIIRGLYYFYQGVFAMEIKHPNFVARYGEILGRQLPGISKGRIVKAGQQIGRVGTVSSRCCAPMLHFELYKGTASGSLTRYRRPPFDRRSDLMNPTDHLRKWEKAQFGKSY